MKRNKVKEKELEVLEKKISDTEPDNNFAAPERIEQELPTEVRDLGTPGKILDPGFNLTLRPMQYAIFYEMYQDAIKNTWTVDEIDFSDEELPRGLRDEVDAA